MGVRLALAHHQGRISPVFDVASRILLIDFVDGQEAGRREYSLSRTDAYGRAAELVALEAEVLICGAISAPLEGLLAASGIKVFGFVCGPVEELIAAFFEGQLRSPRFWMPGCCCRWRNRAERRTAMGRGLGRGFGGGAGRGGAGGRGRMGGPKAGGPGGFCVCPSCGEKTPHTPGQPCNQMMCPKCGTPMTRV